MMKSLPFRSAFAGLTNVELADDAYDLGGGIKLKQRYGYLFSPWMLAYAPAPKGKHHPAPWSPAEGSQAHEYKVELQVETVVDEQDARDRVWWIAFLFRIACAPYLTAPILSDAALLPPAEQSPAPRLIPFEPYPRIFQTSGEKFTPLGIEDLEWVKSKWQAGFAMIKSNQKLWAVAKAFDDASVAGQTAPSLLPIWSGIETLFSQGKGEIRFRVSVLVSTYLNEAGQDRLASYKKILALYNKRSAAAHTAGKLDYDALLESYVLLRNILIRIIDTGEMPNTEKLEERLFAPQDREVSV